jgi:hypothetical protein
MVHLGGQIGWPVRVVTAVSVRQVDARSRADQGIGLVVRVPAITAIGLTTEVATRRTSVP